MKTFEQIVDDVFVKEGDVYAEPPKVDQPTGRGGITLATLQRFQPGATLTDLQNLTHEDARRVVRQVLEGIATHSGISTIPYEPMRLHMLDFAYNSGEGRAIRWLQRSQMLPATGTMDQMTMDRMRQVAGPLSHQSLIAARIQMVHEWAKAPENKKFEVGLVNRILSFSLIVLP